jgi:hypothetical protein
MILPVINWKNDRNVLTNTIIRGGLNMNENRRKEVFMQKPIERHDTASWADVEKTKPVSKVLVPKEIGVLNAKEYVDENEK